MHFDVHQIRPHELIREADEYRLARQATGPSRLRWLPGIGSGSGQVMTHPFNRKLYPIGR
ncbi:hypothetical protein ACF073_36400 [Streptomyces sp. NPDC015171]|uniref:hypothetical protein n=1 Tax=Streptomyces sp. NPDC015171 TaxID=3364945 RepID=UPI0036F6EC62